MTNEFYHESRGRDGDDYSMMGWEVVFIVFLFALCCAPIFGCHRRSAATLPTTTSQAATAVVLEPVEYVCLFLETRKLVKSSSSAAATDGVVQQQQPDSENNNVQIPFFSFLWKSPEATATAGTITNQRARQQDGNESFVSSSSSTTLSFQVDNNNKKGTATEKSQMSTQSMNLVKGTTCMICLEGFAAGEVVSWSKHNTNSCRHVFHHDCLVPWLQRKVFCPACRTEMLPPRQQEQQQEESVVGNNTNNNNGDVELI